MTLKIHNRLEGHKAELEVRDVWYGEQRLYPNFPCIAVESADKRRTHMNTRRWDLTFLVDILLILDKVDSMEQTRQELERHIHLVEDVLHEDTTMGGSVIFGFVTRAQPGFQMRGSVMRQAARLRWEGSSREVF
jgi:hypothetical protein